MGIDTKTVYTCDICKKEINPEVYAYVDASVYGAVFHTGCAEPALSFVIACAIDDIYVQRPNTNYEDRQRFSLWKPYIVA